MAMAMASLADTGRDSDRLQHLRRMLPGEVRVTSPVHPLFGRVLEATGFKRALPLGGPRGDDGAPDSQHRPTARSQLGPGL
jgi:hypothetical protein